MSTDLHADDDTGLYVTALWSGPIAGACVQITTADVVDTGRAYVILTRDQARTVQHVLSVWLGDFTGRELEVRGAAPANDTP